VHNGKLTLEMAYQSTYAISLSNKDLEYLFIESKTNNDKINLKDKVYWTLKMK
jgi:hypothetical protein